MARTTRSAGAPRGTRFLVERYWPGVTVELLRSGERKVRRASAELNREGHPIRYLGATFVPEEETVFAVFEAEAAEWVAEANRRAGQPVDRLVVVVDLRGADPTPIAPTTPTRAGPAGPR